MSGFADRRVTDADELDRAFGLLEKPFGRDELLDTIERAVADRDAAGLPR
jgi:FixJ family two-component response regulator